MEAGRRPAVAAPWIRVQIAASDSGVVSSVRGDELRRRRLERDDVLGLDHRVGTGLERVLPDHVAGEQPVHLHRELLAGDGRVGRVRCPLEGGLQPLEPVRAVPERLDRALVGGMQRARSVDVLGARDLVLGGLDVAAERRVEILELERGRVRVVASSCPRRADWLPTWPISVM